MSIQISAWFIPAILTGLCLAMMFRPYHERGMFDFGAILRLFWILPIAIIWAVYFGVCLWVGGRP